MKLGRPKKTNPEEFKVNPLQFTNPTTSIVCYLLGFLWGDGYISKNSLCLDIQEEDGKEIFKLIKQTGDWRYRVISRTRYGVKNKDISKINTNNSIICEFLKNYDYSTKSITAPEKILNLIPKNLHHYWWRGYFDADGCATMNKTNGHSKRITFSSSLEQDWSSLQEICNLINIRYSFNKILTKTGNSSYFRITGISNINKFYNFLYPKGFDFGLERKYNKLVQISKYTRKFKTNE